MPMQSKTNYLTFNGRADHYAGLADLFPGERALFESYREQFSGDILDIAIGAGRTTRVLFPSARSYLGIDYSPSMIEAARLRSPEADLRVMDMRAIPESLNRAKYDVILISFNGIDYISWQNRETLLLGLRSLLSETGVLVFSTHDLSRAGENSRFRLRKDLHLAPRELLSSPRRFARLVVRGVPWVLRAWRNYKRNQPLQLSGDGYALVNDDGDDCGLLTVYVSRERQLRQLAEAGWKLLDIVPAGSGDVPEYMYYFVARPERQ